MIKNDTNNNKEELKPIEEESKNEVADNNANKGSFDLFSLKTLLSPKIPPKGNEHHIQSIFDYKYLPAGSYFDLTVTFAVSPDSFVIQPHNQGEQGVAECYNQDCCFCRKYFLCNAGRHGKLLLLCRRRRVEPFNHRAGCC